MFAIEDENHGVIKPVYLYTPKIDLFLRSKAIMT